MSTLGNSTTPTWPTYGWIQQSQKAVGGLYTMPSPGGIISSVSFWASCDGATSDYIWGVIWNTSGTVIAHGSGVLTTGGVTGTGHVGATQFYTDTLTSPLFVAGGTQIYIGWQPNSSIHTTDWAYNGGGSPTAIWAIASGTPSGTPTFSAMSPTGEVAAYATYTPAGGWVMRSGVWQPGGVDVERSSVETAGVAYVMRSGIWQPGN